MNPTPTPAKSPWIKRLRQYLFTGLLVWLPMVVTIWVLAWLVGLLNGIFNAVLRTLVTVVPPAKGVVEALQSVPGLGVVLVTLVLVVTGVFVANMFGQWWLSQWNKIVVRIPLVNTIYTSVKQVSDTLFSGSGKAFSKALLIEYPRKGSWTIAFLTGQAAGEITAHLPADCVSVYVPTTPNPTSGFFLVLPRSEVVELEMSVDDALKTIISMGVVQSETSASDHAAAPGHSNAQPPTNP